MLISVRDALSDTDVRDGLSDVSFSDGGVFAYDEYSIQRCNSCKGNIWFSCSQIQHYNYATDKMR